jgi:hypothetical protein
MTVFGIPVSTEHVKAIASVLQAVGVIFAAFLAYRFARRLESHKYGIRVSEIMFTKFYEKRLSALEAISTLQGKIIYEASPLFLIGTGKEIPAPEEGEDRQSYLRRLNEPIQKTVQALLLELHHAQQAGIVYLPDDIMARFDGFRLKIADLIRNYCSRLQEKGLDGPPLWEMNDRATKEFQELEADRVRMAKEVRAYLEQCDEPKRRWFERWRGSR